MNKIPLPAPVYKASNEGEPRELTAADVLGSLTPAAPHLIQDLIPQGLIMLYGDSKVGKSWFTLRLSLCLISGQNFLTDFELQQTGVVFFALEDDAHNTAERLDILEATSYGEENLHKLVLIFECPILDEKGLQYLERKIKEHPDKKVFIIDVLAIVEPIQPSGMNDYQFVTSFLKPVRALARDTGVTIICIRHDTKYSAGKSITDGMMGSKGYSAAADAVVRLSEQAKDEVKYLLLETTGRKIQKRSVSFMVDSQTFKYSLMNDDDQKHYNASRYNVLKYFQSRPHDELRTKEIIDGVAGSTVSLSAISVKRAISALHSKRQIEKVAHGKYRFILKDSIQVVE